MLEISKGQKLVKIIILIRIYNSIWHRKSALKKENKSNIERKPLAQMALSKFNFEFRHKKTNIKYPRTEILFLATPPNEQICQYCLNKRSLQNEIKTIKRIILSPSQSSIQSRPSSNNNIPIDDFILEDNLSPNPSSPFKDQIYFDLARKKLFSFATLSEIWFLCKN